jgi:hypothetical protein
MANLLAPPGADHCRQRPLSGYHFKVGVTNTEGKAIWFGGFQSLTLSIRNATETYLTLGERLPMYLDGEIQIAWVLEKGLVDGNFLYNLFGTTDLSRCKCLPDTIRFIISFDTDCEGLNYENLSTANAFGQNDREQLGVTGVVDGVGIARNFQVNLLYCKVDNLSIGLMPGRRVAAERWEGVAEGVRFVDKNVATTATTTPVL